MPVNNSSSTSTPSIPNATTMPLNESGDVIWTDNGPVIVDQGPTWLAQLAYNPPEWLPLALAAVAALVVALALLGLYRHGLTPTAGVEVAENAAIGVGVLVVTEAVVAGFSWPYVVDVVVGAVGGFVLAKVGVRLGRRYYATVACDGAGEGVESG